MINHWEAKENEDHTILNYLNLKKKEGGVFKGMLDSKEYIKFLKERHPVAYSDYLELYDY